MIKTTDKYFVTISFNRDINTYKVQRTFTDFDKVVTMLKHYYNRYTDSIVIKKRVYQSHTETLTINRIDTDTFAVLKDNVAVAVLDAVAFKK